MAAFGAPVVPDVNCRFKTSLFWTWLSACFKIVALVFRPSERKVEYVQSIGGCRTLSLSVVSNTQGKEGSSVVTASM